ncbi:hypothetical protein O181_109302 [Austropuccinia psidii MF-1]|uniref:Uncharacterized protein n=1 Tax=Austropuccinia psidii MF-1 TaxID=1389203 RepID=A0A9Q3PRA4_9BASI|nr:hypothetical protein [Austropuccinia psidii MF-1]
MFSSLVSSISESYSDSEASESSIEIKTSPEPRGLITKGPFKGPEGELNPFLSVNCFIIEVEVTTPSNQMDLDQDIQVINSKYKNVNTEERNKWRMPELSPFPKELNHFLQETIEIYQSQYKSCEEVHGARKERRTSEGFKTHVLQRTSTTDKILAEKPEHFIRGPEEEIGPRKGKQPSGSSPSLRKQKYASKSAKQVQTNPKDQPEGQEKGKGKSKAQVEQALPAELQDSQEIEDSHGQCAQYGKKSDGIQKQGRGKIEKSFSKEVDLVKLSTPTLERNVLNLNNDLHHTISSNSEVETACNFENIPRLEEWPTFSSEGEYNHMEFMKTTYMYQEDFNIPDEKISARLHQLLNKSAKKWYYKMRQDHHKHSWPWWKEQIISKWENDFWRFKMENYFEESIFNIERDRPMSWFLKQKDILTSLHLDMSEAMLHKRIFGKCGGDLEHAIRSKCIQPCSTEDCIDAMEDITTRKKIERHWYKLQ